MLTALRHEQRTTGEHDAEDNGQPHEIARPFEPSGHLESRHPGKVHGGDPGAYDSSTEDRTMSKWLLNRDGKARAGDQHRNDEREDRQAKMIAGRDTRLISQHRNEMGGPDAEAGRERSQTKPQDALAVLRRVRTLQQADAHDACQETDRSGQADQPPVMFDSQTREYTVHATPKFVW